MYLIIAKDGGVLVRAGHTEASVDISKLAKNNSAVICEIMNEDGTMAKGQELLNFAQKHKLKIGKIEDLISYRLKKEKLVKLKKSSNIKKIKNQKYKIKIYENLLDGSEHFVLIKGSLKRSIVPRVRVISSNVVYNYLISQKLPIHLIKH